MAEQQARRARRSFTPEFKTEAVRLCKVGDRTIRQVATDLDLTETALRACVKDAEKDAGSAKADSLAANERDELLELRSWSRRLVAAAFALAVVCAQRHADAETSQRAVDLVWSAPPECPSSEFVEERALAEASTNAPRTVHAAAKVIEKDHRYELVVVVRTGAVEETRKAQSASCLTLAEATALVIATALDRPSSQNDMAANEPPPSVKLPADDHGPTTSDEMTVARARRVPEHRPIPAEPATANERHVSIGAATLFDFGTLPRATAGLGASSRARWGA
nr:transposase [Labilithrix luteola]